MSSEHVVELDDARFEAEVIQSDVPVLVDFWAEWCMPCRMQAPAVEELAEEYAGRAKICKLDVQDHRQAAMHFGITAIPAVLVFHNGRMVKKFVGLQQKADLRAALDEALAS